MSCTHAYRHTRTPSSPSHLVQVYCDSVVYPHMDRPRCLHLLRQHVFEHIVSVRGRHYTQGGGIPQGSVLSTALCNYYYGHMEREGPLRAFWTPRVDPVCALCVRVCLYLRLCEFRLLLSSRCA